MNADVLIEKSLRFSQIKIIKFFFKFVRLFFFGTTANDLKKERKSIVNFLSISNFFMGTRFLLFTGEENMKY